MNEHQTKRKIILLQTGVTEVKVAHELGVTRQAVNNEMRGERKSARIREALCKMTNTPEEKFFPEHVQAEEPEAAQAANQ